MSERTFKVQQPHMEGTDIKAWQSFLNDQMKHWEVDYRIPEDGDYGISTRDLTASVCHGLGLASAMEAMKDGVTPELRVKLRNKNLSPVELARYHGVRARWRRDLRAHHGGIASPLKTILSDSWGYHPPVHDGVDLICPPESALYALCDGEVIRADADGWWGKGAPPASIASKGDGIIIIRSSVRVGPFKPGLNMCYGHAEHPIVKVGQRVRAGQHIGTAGLARAWHVHFMVNGRHDTKGLGDRDPLPFVRFARGRS